MKPWKVVGSSGEQVLQERDGEYVIRSGGHVLMSSRVHGSEEAMASAGCNGAPNGHVLVGGLGLGYTLRAVLDLLSPKGRVTVAEISPAIVEWNRGPLAELAGRPLEDPRVKVETRDVRGLLAQSGGAFDAILLDVDNGPAALARKGNAALYVAEGISAARAALKPRGVLVVWSAGPDSRYLGRLEQGGFEVQVRQVAGRG